MHRTLAKQPSCSFVERFGARPAQVAAARALRLGVRLLATFAAAKALDRPLYHETPFGGPGLVDDARRGERGRWGGPSRGLV